MPRKLCFAGDDSVVSKKLLDQFPGIYPIENAFSFVVLCFVVVLLSGPRFNIKMTSYQHRKSHCGDKTILRPSYLHNGISYTGKTTSLY